ADRDSCLLQISADPVAQEGSAKAVVVATAPNLRVVANLKVTIDEPETVHEIRKFQGVHQDPVWCVAFAPDGKHAVSSSGVKRAGADQNIRVWDVHTGKSTYRIGTDHQGPIHSLAFGPKGYYLVSGGAEKRGMRIWEFKSGRHVQSFDQYVDSVLSVAFSPDGHYVLSGGLDGLVLASRGKNEKPRRLGSRQAPINSVAFSPDSRFVVSGGLDTNIQRWRVENGQRVGLFEGEKG